MQREEENMKKRLTVDLMHVHCVVGHIGPNSSSNFCWKLKSSDEKTLWKRRKTRPTWAQQPPNLLKLTVGELVVLLVDHPGQNRVRKRKTEKQNPSALNLVWRVLWRDMKLNENKKFSKKGRYFHFIPGWQLLKKISVPPARIPLQQWRFSVVSLFFTSRTPGPESGDLKSCICYFSGSGALQKPLTDPWYLRLSCVKG